MPSLLIKDAIAHRIAVCASFKRAMADSELTEASKYRSIQSLFAVPDVSTILREDHRLRRWWREGSYRVVSDPHISD